MRIAFFVRGVRERDLSRAEFYRQDLRILSELGHEVYWASSALSIKPATDLVFAWWWTHAWEALAIAMLRRIPVLITGVFDLPFFSARPLHERVLMSTGARMSHANVFVSEFERSGVATLLRLRRAYHIPLAVDVETYLERERASTSSYLIGNITWKRLANMRRKMLPELIEAMAIVAVREPRARLVLAGPPEDGEIELRRLVHRLRLDEKVEFQGELTLEQKIALQQRCDVYVQCSRYEGFGLAIAEAMSCAAPVLVTPVGAVPELVGDAGEYVRGESSEAIAFGILRLLGDRERRNELGRRAAARIRSNFTVQRRMRDLAEVLRELTSVSSVRS